MSSLRHVVGVVILIPVMCLSARCGEPSTEQAPVPPAGGASVDKENGSKSSAKADEKPASKGDDKAEVAPKKPVEGSDKDGVRLPEVVVTAPPIIEGTEVQRDSSVVTTVSDKQMEALNAQDLEGALRRVPGVTISRYNPVGSYGGGDGGAIYIRGQGSGRPGAEISTMFDGIPRYQGVFQHPVLDNTMLDMASRIDVYKSAQPVMIGSMGSAAVNVVPKRRDEEGFEGRVLSEYGSFNTWISEVENGGKVKFFDYYVTASHRESDGNRKNADGEENAVYGRVGFRPDQHWDVNFQINHTDSFSDDPGMKGVPRPPVTPRFPTNNELYLLTVGHTYDNVSGSIKLYLDDGHINWRQWDSAANEQFNSATNYQNYGLRWQENVRPWDGGEAKVGFDVDSNGGHYAERRPGPTIAQSLNLRFANRSPYASLSHKFETGKDWEVTPSLGGRYTFSREFDDQWGLQAGVSARNRTTDTTLYGNFARSFNLPGPWVRVFLEGYGRGDQWKDLQAETINHFELGAMQGFLHDKINLTVSCFHDRSEHALRFVPPPPPPPSFANLGTYTLQGVEAAVHVHPIKNLDLFVGATYLDPDPQTVPNAPRWTASGGLGYTWHKRLSFNLDMQFVDSQNVANPRFPGQGRVDSFFLLNSRLGYRFTPDKWRAQMEVFTAGENLTNEHYEYRPGYPQPGASGMIGFNLKF